MLTYVKKSAQVLREEGAGVFVERAARNLRIRGARFVSRYHWRNLRRWRELRDRFRGQRAFLIGNGPSLNVTPMHLLEGEHTLCFNRFNLMYERLRWRPTMYMNIDSAVVTDMAGEIHEIIKEVPFAFIPDVHNDGTRIREVVGDAPNIFWLYPGFRGFYDSLPHYGLGGTVAFAGIQTLVFLGFNPIYLIGADVSYRIHETAMVEGDAIRSQADDDPNHFDPRYFGSGRKYHQPDAVAIDKMRRAYALSAVEVTRRGVLVQNAGVGGRLESFERVSLRSLVPPSRDDSWEREAIISVARSVRPVTEADLFGCQVSASPSPALAMEPVFALDAADSLEWTPRFVVSHVPFGPLRDGRSIFVKRV